MNFMVRLILTSFLVFAYPQFALGQINKGGVPVIENFNTLNTPGSEQNWCTVKDLRGVMYFGNNDKGILEYDGHFWNRITIPENPRVYDLAVDSTGMVYVAAAFEFGYLEPDIEGNMGFISLADKIDSTLAKELGVVLSILIDDDRVIFSTQKLFLIYYPDSDSVNVIDHSGELYQVLKIKKVWDRIFVGDNVAGIYELKGDSLVGLPGGSFFSEMPVMSILPGRAEGELIIGSFYDGVVSFNYVTGYVNETFVNSELNKVLIESNVYNGISLSDTTFAIGTVSGGGIFIFNKSGKLLEQYDSNNSELLDNTILSMYFDSEANYPILWINNFGYISKAYLGLPFKVVNLESVNNSAAIAMSVYKNNLYVSSDAGVIKSFIGDNDYLNFEPLDGISNQTFSLINFKNRSSDLLIAGSIAGLYSYDGSNLKMIGRGSSMNVRGLLQSTVNPDILYVGLVRGGVEIFRYSAGDWISENQITRNNGITLLGETSIIEEDKNGNLWVITSNPTGLFNVQITESDTILSSVEIDGYGDTEVKFVKRLGDDLMVGTGSGIYKYDYNNKTFIPDDRFKVPEVEGKVGYDNFFVDPDGDVWFSVSSSRNFICYFPADGGPENVISKPFFMLPNTVTGSFETFLGGIWIVKSKQLFVVDKKRLIQYSNEYETLIRRVIINGDSLVFGGTFYSYSENDKRVPSLVQSDEMVPEIRHSDNDLSFYFSSPLFLGEDSIRFSYLLQPFDKDWSKWDNINYRDYTNLPHGKYTFRVRSRNMLGNYGNEATYKFVILRPWYLSLVAILFYIILGVFLIIVIIKVYTRRLINENLRLEGIVQERTKEVVRQKEELESSIHYASRIQRAILPSQKLLKKKVPEYFILFRPRDIVSGDFYWVTEKENRLFICAADCTGHGVPGAFMSILGISFLDEIVNKSSLIYPDEILDSLRQHVTESLKQMGEDDEETKDGMDLGLLAIDYTTKQIEFSGAYNPCWAVRSLTKEEKKSYNEGSFEVSNGDLTDGEHLLQNIDADRMPIGISSRMDQKFTRNTMPFEKGTTYYILSDGYSDQFGGESGRKFLKKNFKKLILEIQGTPIQKQNEILEKRLLDWMGDLAQVDDILVIGVRVV
jgi:serine phosphatase RsbU (regulator of sigma subunit)